MTTRLQSPGAAAHRFVVAALAMVIALGQQPAPRADGAAQTLPFPQNWANTGLISVDDNWSLVPGIVGYRGDDITTATGVDPQTLLADGTATPVDVNANQLNPTTFATGGVAEFHIANPTVAIQGSGTADAPFLLLTLNTNGFSAVHVAYNVRDLDGSADNALQQVALHYRVGSSGPFTNVPAGYIADATTAGAAVLVTPVSTALPAAANNQPLVQIRVMTTNAAGNDEWVGVDDINITGTQITIPPSGVGAATPAIVSRGGASLLTVTVTPGQAPASTGLVVSADLSAIGGSASQLFSDDGVSNGDVAAADNVFSFAATVNPTAATGAHVLPASILDAQLRPATASINLKVAANTVPQPLTFSQDWSDSQLIAAHADWSSVPGVTGFLGDDAADPEGVNPETIIGDTTNTAIHVIANQADPNTSADSGVAEFDTLANPTVALRGSNAADAPFLLITLDTTGRSGIHVAYNLRDFNPAASNAIQQFALQYRVGTSGNFFNVPEGFVLDANNPSDPGGVTPVSAELPPDADNQPIVQVRIITANAVGDDQWIGVDDVVISAPQIELSGAGEADPSVVGVGQTTTLRATITPGLNPSSTGIAASVDLSPIGGVVDQPLNESSSGVFSITVPVAPTTNPGMKALRVTATDEQQRFVSFDIALEVRAPTSPSATGSASPSNVFAGDGTLLTAAVTSGTFPPSSGITVFADLTAVGGSHSQAFSDDGTGGDITAGDQVFSLQFSVGAATPSGVKLLPLTISDAEGRIGSTAFSLTVLEQAAVSVSQVYGGGGNSGASIKNDFIELRNLGTNTVNLAGWSVQYSSAAGSTWLVTPLSGSIAPGGYYLIQEAQGAGGTVNLPPADAVGTIAMASGAGKVALVRTTTPLTGACPITSGLPIFLDFVGYGSTATCFEGSGPVGNLSNTTAALRLANGCLDTNNNSTDFSRTAASPRNSSFAAADCSVAPPPNGTPTPINQIQGNTSASLLTGQVVTTPISIVTGVKSNGFFIQTPSGSIDDDNNPNTSEGIFVFTSGNPGAAAIGNAVQVTGTVVEFIPSAEPNSAPTTEISGPVTTLVSVGNALPAPVTLTAADTSPAGSGEQLERFEGMRVHVASLTAISGTQGSVNEPNATSTSNGVFFAVVTGVPRPFREPGIRVPDPLPTGAPPDVPRFDANPERLRVDSDGQLGAAQLNVHAGAILTGVTGVLDYAFRTYTILPDAATPPAVANNNLAAAPLPDPTVNQFTVGSANLERFFDTVNDPAIGDPVLTPTALNNRLNKVSLYIRNILRTPDILAVEEVENLGVLQAIADRVNGDTLADGQPDPNYAAFLVEGNDIGGIDSGFLVKLSRVTVIDVTQFGAATTFTNPDTGQQDLLHDRPPLLLRATIQSPAGNALPLTVIVNHLRSLLGAESEPRVRAKRAAQAEFLAKLIQARQLANPSERIISVGDFNAFEFNDGFVDVIGTIKGTPTPASQVVTASPDLVNPDLIDLADLLLQEQRYSYSFDGNGQVLDHHLITQNLLPMLDRFVYARNNADFAEVVRNDASRPERISDHDTPVSYFNFPHETTTTVTSTLNPSVFGQSVTFNATVTTGGSPVTLGAVVFKDGDTVLGSVTLNGSGQALFTTSSLSSGPHAITAEFVGSGNLGVSSASVTQTVNPSATTTTVTTDINPSEFNETITITATVTGTVEPATEGSVTFKAGATVLAGPITVDGLGKASFSLATISVGAHVITAEYSGSGNFSPSTASFTQTVRPLPSISINDVTVTEVNTGTINAVFTVSLSAPSGRTVTADFTTSDGTAVSPSDYVSRTGTITFPPGTVTQTIAVAVNGDTVTESNEIFAVGLSSPTNGALVDDQAIATITNDDAYPTISIDNVTVTEPDSGSTPAVFTVSLSHASELTTLVHFRTANGLAVAGSDYETTSGTVVFGPGVLTQTISVPVLADSARETVQLFFVNLSLATNATIRDAQGLGLIYDASSPEITGFSPPTGAAGTIVTITGSNFTGILAVRFGSAFASFTVLSPTTIRAVVPTLAITAPISVVSLSGIATSETDFGVLPRITSFTPASGTVGTVVTLSGSGFTGVTSVRFNGVAATITSVTTTQIRASVLAGSTTGPITVVTPAGVASSATNFRVLPRITSFTPSSGPAGRRHAWLSATSGP